MKRVFICSPFRATGGNTGERFQKKAVNIRNAALAAYAVTAQGNMPLAPHLYFPCFLDDNEPRERELGLALARAWLKIADEVVVYADHTSEGMKAEIELAKQLNKPIKYFTIERDEAVLE